MGIRVIKTAIAALAALYTAYYLGLDTPLSAGLLAILGVEVTRKKGLKNAFARFTASVLGLFFASLLFLLFGFHIWTISLFILLVFPILSRMQLKDGIVTSSVIVFHVFARESVTIELIGNEIMLLLTGLGWATLINFLYMPKEDENLAMLRMQTEQSFADIFILMGQTLRNPSLVWSGEELLVANKAIEEGLRRAEWNQENRLWGKDRTAWNYYPAYFEMRRQQLESIQQMLVQLSYVYESLPQGELVAEQFDILADNVKSEVYEGDVERKLPELKEQFKSMPLPQSRQEFEVRAAILQLMYELARYLNIAKRLKKQRSD